MINMQNPVLISKETLCLFETSVDKQILRGHLALLFNDTMVSFIRLNYSMVKRCKDVLITPMNVQVSVKILNRVKN